MSKKVEKISFFTPVVANKTSKNERFKSFGRFAENVWNFAGTKRQVKVIHVSDINKNVFVEPSENNYVKQNFIVTVLKIIGFISLFPLIFAAKIIYRTKNSFYFVMHNLETLKKNEDIDDQQVEVNLLHEDSNLTPKKVKQLNPKDFDDVDQESHSTQSCSLIFQSNYSPVKANSKEIVEPTVEDKNSNDNDMVKPSNLINFNDVDILKSRLDIVGDYNVLEAARIASEVKNIEEYSLPLESTAAEDVSHEDAKRELTLKEQDNEKISERAKEAFESGNYKLALKGSLILISRFNQMPVLEKDQLEEKKQAYIRSILSIEKLQNKLKFCAKLENLQKKDLEVLKKDFLKVYLPYIEKYQEIDPRIVASKLLSKKISLTSGPSDASCGDYKKGEYTLVTDVDGCSISTQLVNRSTVSFTQGNRSSMEDRHLVQKIQIQQKDSTLVEADVFAVFDGHGDLQQKNGELCAEFVSQKFTEILIKQLSCKNDLSDLSVWNALKSTTVDLQEAWIKANKQVFSGTTLCAAFVLNNPNSNKRQLWVLNVGDSRAVISIKDSENGLRAVQLTNDTKLSKDLIAGKDFSTGLFTRHGTLSIASDEEFYRVGSANGLQTMRTLGNQNIEGLSARPEITCFDLTELADKKLTLLLATDGLTDCIGSLKAMQVIDHLDKVLTSNALVNLSLVNGSDDNVTVITTDLSF